LKQKENDMQALQIIVGLTVTALILYYFVGKADESSKLIKGLADGYTNVVGALQGR
jgi:hypothetical protein